MLIEGINLPTQALDDVFLEGEARRSAAFEHQLAMTKHYSENQRKGEMPVQAGLTDFQMPSYLSTAISFKTLQVPRTRLRSLR